MTQVHLRPEWGARPPLAPSQLLWLEPYVAIHHIGAGDPWMPAANVPGWMNRLQLSEMRSGYKDFSYNWCIDLDGDEWEGRGNFADGATLGYSGNSMSILVLANAAHPAFVMRPQVIDGIARCIRRHQLNSILSRTCYIDSHQWFDAHVTKYPTACPSKIIQSIQDIRDRVYHPGPKPEPVPKPRPTIVKEFTVANGTLATGLMECSSKGFGYFEGAFDAKKPVKEVVGATIHGPNTKTDGLWPWTVDATVRAQVRGNKVIVGVKAPHWKQGNPLPAVHVTALV